MQEHSTAAPQNGADPDSAADPTVEDLNRIVAQAEALLRELGEDTGDAADAVRARVSDTLEQARTRLAATAEQAGELAETLAQRTDRYVRGHPWQSVAIAALLGGVVTLLLTRVARR